MKTLYLTTLFGLVFLSYTKAQITLGNNHHPTQGSGYEMQFTDHGQSDFDLTSDATTSWNLGNLKLSGSSNYIGYVKAKGTKYDSKFSAATLAAGAPSNANNGIYQYYGLGKDQLEYHGYVSNVFTIDSVYTYPVAFDHPLISLKFPLNHKDSFSSSSTYKSLTKRPFGEEGEVDSVFGHISRNVKINGFGIMTMPNKSSHEILRLRIQENKRDSIVSDTGYTISEYNRTWFEFHSAEYALPLVTVYLHNDQVSAITTLDLDKSTKIVGLPSIPEAPESIYPNPASNHISIEFENASSLEILSLQGQVMGAIQVNGKTQADLSFLPSGVFIAIFKNEDHQTIGRTRLVKNHL